MNFKKYHVSKNLFDEEYPNMKVDIPTYRGIYVGDGTFTLSTTTVRYYDSADIFFMAGNVRSGASTQNNGVWNESPRTVTAVDGYVTIAYRYYSKDTSSDPRSNDVMLNTGSTPQPYEPYSSEVWHDIPHYIHNISTDTLTTLPADIYANDTTATVGLKGDMQQSSQPSPTNPIQPSECGDKTANLFSEPLVDEYTLDGTTGLPKPYPDRCSILNPIDVGGLQNVTITFTATLERTRIIYSLFNNTTLIRRVTAVASGTTIDVSEGNNLYISFYDTNITGSVSGDDISNTMLNSGSTPLPYQPYGQYKIPISSASTTTPVYLGEVQTTRKIYELVLTGEENITQHSVQNDIVGVRIPTPSSVLGASIVICSHYEGVLWPVYNGYRRYGIVASNPSSGNAIVYMSAPDSEHNTLSAFVQWIKDQYAAGTPVTIWYVLATPTTGIVNEPLRKIGDYADTVSGITIPTITGKDSFDVLTTLKPSEVSLAYTGWHDATVKEWDGSEWQ